MEHFVDTVLILKPMELSSCADYNGKLIIGKLASFNTFLYEPLSVDWATKLTRKKLCIEVILIFYNQELKDHWTMLYYIIMIIMHITRAMNFMIEYQLI